MGEKYCGPKKMGNENPYLMLNLTLPETNMFIFLPQKMGGNSKSGISKSSRGPGGSTL